MHKIGIVEFEDFSNIAYEKLKTIGDVEIFNYSLSLDDFIKDKDIIFIRLQYRFDKNVLNVAKQLKYICSPTTGLTHIDLDEINNRGIEIISLKGETDFLENIRATPEHVIGLLLSLLRNYKNIFSKTFNKYQWDRNRFRGFEIYNRNIGIIGFGRVGKIVSQYLKSFNSNVFFYDIKDNITSEYATKMDTIENLVKQCSVIILAASVDETNFQLINSDIIDLMKDKYFINISRGELVDEQYLLKKIEEKHFKGIAIDVIQNETEENNNLEYFLSLIEDNNLIVTPHIGGATFDSMKRTEEFTVDKLMKILKKNNV